MPFRNSIIGGVGALIRQYIKSPNYVAGVSGWSINKDGTAEFNSATFRGTVVISAADKSFLVYSGAPAVGNLILAVAAVAGTDSLGNNYGAGLTIGGNSAAAAMRFMLNDGTSFATLYNDSVSGSVKIEPVGTKFLHFGTSPASMAVQTANGIKFGTGRYGFPYAELATLAAGAGIASGGALKNFTSFGVQQSDNDYASGSAFSGGGANPVIWTAPDTGWYLFTLSVQYQAWVAASITRAGLAYTPALIVGPPWTSGFIGVDEHPSSNNGRIVLSVLSYINVNDVVTPQILQSTGALQIPDAGYTYLSVKKFL